MTVEQTGFRTQEETVTESGIFHYLERENSVSSEAEKKYTSRHQRNPGCSPSLPG